MLLDIEEKIYVAFYNSIQDIIKGNYIYKHIYTMIPLLIDAENIDEARMKAKLNSSKTMILDEVREINLEQKKQILSFYK